MHPTQYRLHHYWRSSSSWRVRMSFEWKGISFEAVPVHLLNGESESDGHLQKSAAGFVPVLEIILPGMKPEFLTESLAIIRYLEEAHPELASVLPGNALDRARIWALSEIICSDTQPLQNIPVMDRHSSDPEEKKRWSRHWIRQGLQVYEKTCEPFAGKFSHGDKFSLADICLLPQLYNAERFDVSLEGFSCIQRIARECKALPAYLKSHPDNYQ